MSMPTNVVPRNISTGMYPGGVLKLKYTCMLTLTCINVFMYTYIYVLLTMHTDTCMYKSTLHLYEAKTQIYNYSYAGNTNSCSCSRRYIYSTDIEPMCCHDKDIHDIMTVMTECTPNTNV